MTSRTREAFTGALAGLLVGFVWEGFGALYLWELAAPRAMIFLPAMVAWALIGFVMAVILRRAERVGLARKVFIKPLAGPLALIVAKITMEVGLISFTPGAPGILGVPLYMMTGFLVLIYLLDDLLEVQRKP